MRRVVVNGHLCILGLRWSQTESRSKADIISELNAVTESYDRFIIVKDRYGVGLMREKQRQKAFALAAVVCFGDSPNLVAVYAFEDENGPFWWVIGIRHGQISSRSDQLFETSDDAEAFARSLQDTLGIDSIQTYSHEEGMTHLGEVLANLSNTLLHASRLTSPRQLTRAKVLKALVALAVLVGLCWGASSFMSYKERLERAEKSRIAAVRKNERIKEIQEHPENHFNRKWMSAPATDAVIEQCVPAMFRHPLAANGWKLSTLSCDGKSMSTTWEQTEFSEYTSLPFNARLDIQRPRFATSHAPVASTLPKTERDIASLLSIEEATQRLYAVTQRFSLKSKLAFKKRATKEVQKTVVTCPWMEGTWELSSLPAYMVADYNNISDVLNIPGFIIKEILFEKNTWKLKGEVYAK